MILPTDCVSGLRSLTIAVRGDLPHAEFVAVARRDDVGARTLGHRGLELQPRFPDAKSGGVNYSPIFGQYLLALSRG